MKAHMWQTCIPQKPIEYLQEPIRIKEAANVVAKHNPMLMPLFISLRTYLILTYTMLLQRLHSNIRKHNLTPTRPRLRFTLLIDTHTMSPLQQPRKKMKLA